MNMRKPKFLFGVKELTHFNTMISGIVASWGESIRTQCFLGHDCFSPSVGQSYRPASIHLDQSV